MQKISNIEMNIRFNVAYYRVKLHSKINQIKVLFCYLVPCKLNN
jgi:hypothetical protein